MSSITTPNIFPITAFSRGDFGVGVGGQGGPNEAYIRTPQGGASAARHRPTPKSPTKECPRQDSNLYAVSDTGPSNQPVYQFQHVGSDPSHRSYIPIMLGEGLEPSRG